MAICSRLPSLLLPVLVVALAGATRAPARNLPHEEGATQGRAAPRELKPVAPLLEGSLRAPAYRLWEASGFGSERSERAAWVLEDDTVGVRWQVWPDGHRYLRVQWNGPVPVNVVAIVHTHLAVLNPKPSRQDIDTARQLGVPVYTVSRSGIWKALPDGSVVAVDDDRWWNGCRSGDCGAPERDPEFRRARGASESRNFGAESAYR